MTMRMVVGVNKMNNISIIQNTYDLLAQNYNEHFKDEHYKKPKDLEVLLKFAKLVKNKNNIWDIGCGSGHTTKYLFDLGVNISGLDLSFSMINIAQKQYKDIHFQQGDILNLDFKENSIDAIISFYSIVHFSNEQVEIAFKGIYKILKSNGLFLFSFHVGENTIHLNKFLNKNIDIDFMFFNIDFITAILKKTGYKDIEIIQREPYNQDIEYQSKRCYIFCKK